jgi:hypothetical protein
MESLPYWPEDSDIIRPIPAKSTTEKIEIKQEKEKDNAENNDNNKAYVRSMEAYTRVIESVLFNKSKNELFPSIKEVLLQWKIYGNALKTVENSIHNTGNSNSDSDDDNEYKRIIEKEEEKNKERDRDGEKDKEKDKRIQISKKRKEQDEEEELNKNNSNNLNNSGSIGLLNRLDEIVDIKKNVIITNKGRNKDKNKDRNEEKEECDVVQVQISTLRSYTVGSSIESIMNNN